MSSYLSQSKMKQSHIQTALVKAYLMRRIEEEILQETKLRNIRLTVDSLLMQNVIDNQHIHISRPSTDMNRTQLITMENNNEPFGSANMSVPSPITSANTQNQFSTQTTDPMGNTFISHLGIAQNQYMPNFTVEQSLAPPSVASSGSNQSSSASIILCSHDEAPKLLVPSDRKSKKSSRSPKSFDDRFQSLLAFKEIYGHCNVPHRSKEHRSLGNWCNNIRTSWRIVKNGGEPASYKLRRDQIEKLDKIGFKWRLYSSRKRQMKKKCKE